VSDEWRQLGYVLGESRWFPTWLWGKWMMNDTSRVLRWLWKLKVRPAERKESE
jgi:hypothetical protein